MFLVCNIVMFTYFRYGINLDNNFNCTASEYYWDILKVKSCSNSPAQLRLYSNNRTYTATEQTVRAEKFAINIMKVAE